MVENSEFKHIYLYIEKTTPEQFGQTLSKSLNDIERRNGQVIHISTQVIPGFSAGDTAWIGHLVIRFPAEILGSTHGITTERGGFVDLTIDEIIADASQANKP